MVIALACTISMLQSLVYMSVQSLVKDQLVKKEVGNILHHGKHVQHICMVFGGQGDSEGWYRSF